MNIPCICMYVCVSMCVAACCCHCGFNATFTSMTWSALFAFATKAIIFVAAVAQFLLIYIDEMCYDCNNNDNNIKLSRNNSNNNNRKLWPSCRWLFVILPRTIRQFSFAWPTVSHSHGQRAWEIFHSLSLLLCLFQFALQREGILSCIFAGSHLIELHLLGLTARQIRERDSIRNYLVI